jgi:hypothetical protein
MLAEAPARAGATPAMDGNAPDEVEPTLAL